ncbi:MAG: TIGR03960 family B12-binding radical SAM protein [Thermodesulfobacteriota bacterium]
MSTVNLDDILCRVTQPSRYLGNEKNAVRKDWESVKARICLAFPDLYEVGMSHFGMQILYHVVNARPDLLCERVFSPGEDLKKLLLESNLPLFSLESRRPLSSFDILGVSLLYELNYTNFLEILELSGIPLLSRDRGPEHPLVVGGGPCTVNPEPVADFFDALVVGDGELTLPALADAWIAWKEGGAHDRGDLLSAFAKIEGVYVPAFFAPEQGHVRPLRPEYTGVRRAVLPELAPGLFPDAPVVAFGRPVHDRLRMETGRGCGRSCRFCQAGMVYRPVREREVADILRLTGTSLSHTGYEDLSLLSLSTGDYTRIGPLMQSLMCACEPARVAVSFPSLRADTLTPELTAQIKRVRKTGFTIAPEAGSQRLRDVINKNLTDQEIKSAVSTAYAAGWRNIKLYFMIGLPTETDEDIKGLSELAHAVKDIAGKRADVTVSLGIFIPKPHTPFQWAAMIRPEEAREKIKRLKGLLSRPGIKVRWQDASVSVVEAMMSRGGREMSRVILAAFRAGCRMDGWTDSFDFTKWIQAAKDCGLDLDAALHAERGLDAVLPWDHVDVRVEKEFLASEWKRALSEKTTRPCAPGECHMCGACDFEPVKTRYAADPGKAPERTEAPALPPVRSKVRLTYTKTGPARFFGHLEFVSLVHRAIRRAGIPVDYSQGFHPLPKVSFYDALPVLMESEQEDAAVSLVSPMDSETLCRRLNAELPPGISVRPAPAQVPVSSLEKTWYRINLALGAQERRLVAEFMERKSLDTVVTDRRGRSRALDLRQTVPEIRVFDGGLFVCVKNEDKGRLNPVDALCALFQKDREELPCLRVLKMASEP